jgi:CBS domain-containing protein
VGIVSALDFVRRERASRAATRASAEAQQQGPDRRAGEPSTETTDPGGDLVGIHMTSAVQSVPPDMLLRHAAQIMCVQHVHRLPVLDKDDRLAGLITCMDVVAAMINAIDESEQFSS